MVAILDLNDFAIFSSTSHLDTSNEVSILGLLAEEKKIKIDFQHGCRGGHLGFSTGMISAIFDLQVAPILPIKFRFNWPLGSGEKVQNRFTTRQL